MQQPDRAVHVKLVPDLSTEMFVLAFGRFINNKGMPHTIYLHNETNVLPAYRTIMDKIGLNIIIPEML